MSRVPHALRRILGIGALSIALGAGSGLVLAPASAERVLAPGTFRGFGFDQCEAPTKQAMHRWMVFSPFQAVGIYISGNSRGCRTQANLDADWVAAAAADSWRLLPLTVGPQARCNPYFPRYGDDPRISADITDDYAKAREQGRAEAHRAVAAAKALGIGPRRTLWYDLEHFDITKVRCRESALAFVHGWTRRLHQLDYRSGFYSSASTGIKMLDDARLDPENRRTLPDRIWVADWDGKANLHSDFIANDGWRPGNRMKQYRGGHQETWGGVTIEIDSNWLELGPSASPPPEPMRCGGVRVNFSRYRSLAPGSGNTAQVAALQCLLRGQGFGSGTVDGVFDAGVAAAVRDFKSAHGRARTAKWHRADWVMLLSTGKDVTLKRGSTSAAVRRLQRSLNAAVNAQLEISGVFTTTTRTAVRDYQRVLGMRATGNVLPAVWAGFAAGTWG